jgi:hypothetical protein
MRFSYNFSIFLFTKKNLGKAYPLFINKEEHLQNRIENERKRKRKRGKKDNLQEENAEAFSKRNKNEADLIVHRSVRWRIVVDER